MKKFAFIPNRGARIGHQFSEWLRSYVFCKENNYEFYHHNFLGNSEKLDDFLNLSYNEKKINDYKGNIITKNDMKIEEYLFSDFDDLYVYDYADKFYFNTNVNNNLLITNDIRDNLRNKYFFKHTKKKLDVISVHIRRDDVTVDSEHFKNRYININYFMRILESLYKDYSDFEVMIFSSNVDDDFFKINNLPFKFSYHINENLEDSINYMINSKILITSKSGISFLSTLLSDNDNIKLCPNNFWLNWPNECKIILNNEEM